MKAFHISFKLLLLLAFSLVAVNALAGTLIVTKAQDTNDGACDDDCSLREAVAAAISGDTIVFSDLFNTPQTIVLAQGEISIGKSLTITGPGSGLLSISGNNVGRIFFAFLNQPILSLGGMHLRNARNTASSSGGAIAIQNGSLTLTDMVLSDNYVRFTTTGSGSAIFAINTIVAISNSSFYNNTAVRGTIDVQEGSIMVANTYVSHNTGDGVVGALSDVYAVDSVFHSNTGHGVGTSRPLTLQNCQVTNNRNGGVASGDTTQIDESTISFNERFNSLNQSGGGISNSGHAVITNTTIANNRVNGNAGGIRNSGTMYISNSSIVDNEGGISAFADATGGGIYNSAGDIYLTNSTVSGNLSVWGAGIFNRGGAGARVYFTNSTVAFNRSSIGAGGIVNESGGVATLRNSIVAKNTRNQDFYDMSGVVLSQGFNLLGPQNDSSGWLTSDLVGIIVPILAPLGNNGGPTLTHAIHPKSPAICGGSNALAIDPLTKLPLTTDQRGSAREIGGTVDIGAYEANYSSSPVSLTGKLVTITGRGVPGARVTLTGGLGDIRYTLTNPFGYYRFLNLPAGTTYTITGSDKLYTFGSPITLTTDQDRGDLILLGGF